MKKITAVLWGTLLILSCGGTHKSDIKVPGIVEGDIITLKSMVSGRVDRVSAEEGTRISENQMLVEINSDKIENRLEELEIGSREIDNNTRKINQNLKLVRSTIQYLEKQVMRFKRLKAKKSLPGEKLESMELQLLEARTNEFELQRSKDDLQIQFQKIQNQRKHLELMLDDHRVQSPIKGILMEIFVSPGENVFPNTPLVDLLDTSSLFIDLFIEEREISSLKLGQRARIIVDGMEDRSLSGSVCYFGKKAEFSPKYVISEKERKSLLYRVKIAIDRDIHLFKIGMPVTVILSPSQTR